MTVMIILLSFAVAILMIMIYAGQCYTSDLADRITALEKKCSEIRLDICRLDGKTDRIIRRIKEMEDER